MRLDNKAIDDFFNRYAARVNEALAGKHPDVEATADAFAEYFIESSPLGIVAGENNDKFREAIPQGWAFYRNIGIRSMDIVAQKIEVLDDFHSMARIQWRSSFTKKDGRSGAMEFQVIYLVHVPENEKPRIFAYITGDEHQALKNEGLV